MAKDNNKPLSYRRQALAEALPKFGWNVTQAALSVGYSPSYVDKTLPAILKRDAGFCREVEQKRREMQRESGWDREALEQRYRDLHDNCKSDQPAVAKGSLDSLSRIQGLFMDKLVSTTEDVQPLTPDERSMLQAIAKEFRRRKAVASVSRPAPEAMDTLREAIGP